MNRIKTAISMKKTLFQEVNSIAKKLQISRSKLFVLAMEDFIKKYRNKRLLQKINEAHADGMDKDEKLALDRVNLHFHKVIDKW